MTELETIMENNDLEFIYNQLKDQYDLVLTNAFALDTGFNADINVLSGKSLFGTFYLYKATDPEFIFEVNLSDGTYTHWYPDSKEEALQDVFDFMDNAIGWLCEELGIDI
jgi:hypothetical protein